MALLTSAALASYVLEQVKNLVVPQGPERRRGAVERAADVLRMVRRDIRGILRLVEAGRLRREDALTQLTELVLELTSLLFAAGADHRTWRHWSGMTALGFLLLPRPSDSAQYAALGGEWALLSEVPHGRPPRRLADRVAWAVLLGQATDFTSRRKTDEFDRAWLTLASSIPRQDHPSTEQALKTIARHWLEEDDDWRDFHARSAPDFEPALCALAALARRNGLRPKTMTPDELAFLEPGLAEPEPVPLWPETFSGISVNGSAQGVVCPS
jgi:hypothetical protein